MNEDPLPPPPRRRRLWMAPNVHHFKHFAIKVLQYEMNKMLKTKAEGLILFNTNFYGTDVIKEVRRLWHKKEQS